jgi:hypothetical protein
VRGLESLLGGTFCKKFPPAPPFKNSYMAGGNIGMAVGATGGRPFPSPFSKGRFRGIFAEFAQNPFM